MSLPLALSTSWNSNRHHDGEAMLQEIRALGFKTVELGHGVRFSLWPGVLKALRENVVEVTSLHNFCPVPVGVLRPSPDCYQFTDPHPQVRETAIRYTLETIDQAARLGVELVVLHLGWGGPGCLSTRLESWFRQGRYLDRRYVAEKLRAVERRAVIREALFARVKACLTPLVEAAAKAGVRLGCECRALFEEFPNELEMKRLLEEFPMETVGYWHDFGHAQRKEFLGWHDHEQTLLSRAGRLIGCHVHDCRSPNEDHLPLGHGEINFRRLVPLIPETAVRVLELSPRAGEEQVIASRNLWNSFQVDPVESR